MKRALLVLLSATLLGLGCGDDDDSGSGKTAAAAGSSGSSGGKSDAGTPSSTQVAKKMITAKSGGTIESRSRSRCRA